MHTDSRIAARMTNLHCLKGDVVCGKVQKIHVMAGSTIHSKSQATYMHHIASDGCS